MQTFFGYFESLLLDDTAAHYYGVIRAQLEHNGTVIGANDLLIASISLANDCTLVTRNQDEFQRVPGLPVEIW